MFDVTLSFFVTVALISLWLALHKDARYFFLWGICTAVAVLIKSVLGLFPAVISVAFLLATGRWKKLFSPAFLGGCAIIVLVGFSWYRNEAIIFGKSFYNVHFGWLIIERGFQNAPESWYCSFIIHEGFAGVLLAVAAVLLVRLVSDGSRRHQER